ncbi:MAG: hypothetical protein K1060chlam2_01136 [Chlamydiae bacterium]|nr:hypothetical protein [Chlamydiota bacterium]
MKRFFFLLLVGIMAFLNSKGEAARLDPESHAMLSNPKYAKYIDVQCYLVTREQLGELFSQKDGDVTQLPNDKLPLDNVYLLIRCKNKGDHMAFGVLNCFIPNRGSPLPIEIDSMRANMNYYNDSAVYIRYGVSRKNKNIPQIRYEWDCLYVM